MISPERIDALQLSWLKRLLDHGAESILAFKLFDRLVEAYSQSHRHYHTLEHIAEMLKIVGRLSTNSHSEVFFAVWYHDAVYDPMRQDNEEASVELMLTELRQVPVSEPILSRVSKLIMLTKHSETINSMDSVEVLMHSADLAILGASEKRYQRYASAIRLEYLHVPDCDYRKGREEVLQSFLDREQIFLHPLLHAEGEEQARRNIQQELQGLK